jgi:hypothetical protein
MNEADGPFEFDDFDRWSLQLACAVTRRRFPVGASPTRQPLQPEATGVALRLALSNTTT